MMKRHPQKYLPLLLLPPPPPLLLFPLRLHSGLHVVDVVVLVGMTQ